MPKKLLLFSFILLLTSTNSYALWWLFSPSLTKAQKKHINQTVSRVYRPDENFTKLLVGPGRPEPFEQGARFVELAGVRVMSLERHSETLRAVQLHLELNELINKVGKEVVASHLLDKLINGKVASDSFQRQARAFTALKNHRSSHSAFCISCRVKGYEPPGGLLP